MSPRMREWLRGPGWVCGIACAALLLRLWGIRWGLPDQYRWFSCHPDEGVNLVNGVLDSAGLPRPHISLGFYNYGGLYFYVWQAMVAVCRSYGLMGLGMGEVPPITDPAYCGALLSCGRLVSALLGALAAWPTYVLGLRLYGRTTGLLGAALAVVLPLAVVHSRFATVDASAAFVLLCALAAGASLLVRLDVRAALIAGMCCGLAASAKYSSVAVVLAPLTAIFLADATGSGSRMARGRVICLVVLAAGAVFGFVGGCPGIVHDWPRFITDVGFEMRKSREGMGLLFAETGNGWWYHLWQSLRLGMTLPVLAVGLGGLCLAATRRARADLYLLAFVVPYYLLMGWAQVRFMRYMMPVMPVLAILAARGLHELCSRGRAGTWAAHAAAGVGVVSALFVSLVYTVLMTMPDPRDQARAHIVREVPRGGAVSFATTPWYYTAPLSPVFTLPGPSAARRTMILSEPCAYALRLPAPDTEWDTTVLSSPEPACVVLANFETQDAMRVGVSAAREFLDQLEGRYRRVTFAARLPGPAGLVIRRTYIPNDLMYIMPEVSVYVRDTSGRARP